MKSKASFIIAIAVLIVGMTAGFILLSLVYSGPKWIAFAVFLIYLFILYFTVVFSKRYIKALDEVKKDDEKK